MLWPIGALNRRPIPQGGLGGAKEGVLVRGDSADIEAMPRRTYADPQLFIPTWLFDEELIEAGLAGLDDDMLMSIHLGRFAISLEERVREAGAPRK